MPNKPDAGDGLQPRLIRNGGHHQHPLTNACSKINRW